MPLYSASNFFAASTNNFDGEYDIGEDDDYDQKDSEGFINLYSLPTKIYANLKKGEV